MVWRRRLQLIADNTSERGNRRDLLHFFEQVDRLPALGHRIEVGDTLLEQDVDHDFSVLLKMRGGESLGQAAAHGWPFFVRRGDDVAAQRQSHRSKPGQVALEPSRVEQHFLDECGVDDEVHALAEHVELDGRHLLAGVLGVQIA